MGRGCVAVVRAPPFTSVYEFNTEREAKISISDDL